MFKLFKPRPHDNAAPRQAMAEVDQSRPDDSLAAITAAARELDLEVAIAAHENWKTRLSAYIRGNSVEDLSPERICQDNQCDLGRWLYSERTNHLHHTVAYQYLLAQHKMFHYTASSVVALYQSDQGDQAGELLRTKFAHLSGNIKRTLEDMKLLARLGQRS